MRPKESYSADEFERLSVRSSELAPVPTFELRIEQVSKLHRLSPLLARSRLALLDPSIRPRRGARPISAARSWSDRSSTSRNSRAAGTPKAAMTRSRMFMLPHRCEND
jgi:hypothetical protein